VGAASTRHSAWSAKWKVRREVSSVCLCQLGRDIPRRRAASDDSDESDRTNPQGNGIAAGTAGVISLVTGEEGERYVAFVFSWWWMKQTGFSEVVDAPTT